LSSTLNVQLTGALRKYVDERASVKDVYDTLSEYTARAAADSRKARA
jgi:hypothetical protein